ncbi:tRNA lysidine(34) synthetase TilS [Clostridium sp. BJN0001]|uniref:tRNA lysidine(34) synthetase TilS n=1 Tax=Clostridium sp. BJN0001 TaxID=2930219 RepID=UPI001FD48C3F|nr:tRNA lysidine(34) synthetase TilS [Clostridium sp. BJN0001]
MKEKVMSYILENHLIENGDKVLVALSGGPDSLCLLNILYELSSKLNIKLYAAHLNHMLRGKDADNDEEYVKKVCKKLDIPCFVRRVDVNRYSEEEKLSSEMAGRKARYDFFDEVVEKEKIDKVATAHTKNDQAETVLFRLMRGTGMEGLCGIKVKRDKIIRPILCLTRREVEEYISLKNLNPRIDKTNFEKIYNRNKIRLDILPYMKNNFNKDIIETINRMTDILKKDNAYLNSMADQNYEKYCSVFHSYVILKKKMFSLDEAILTRIIRKAMSKASDSYYDFEMKHIYEIISLSAKSSGKYVDLPNNIYAENVYGDIYIKKESMKNKNSDINNKDIILSRDECTEKSINFGKYILDFKKIDRNIEQNLNKNAFIKYFDYDKIKSKIVVRTRKNGDKIIPLGMKNYKKVKDIFIDMKIEKEKRNNIPIICFDENISWIVGVKFSQQYKVTETTKNILEIIVREEISNE